MVENILLTQRQILWVLTHTVVKMLQSHTGSAYKLTQSAVLFQVVIGGINVDFIAKGKTKTLQVRFIRNTIYPHWEGLMKVLTTCLFQFGQTNPGSVCQSFGGVGRNIAGVLLTDYIYARVVCVSLPHTLMLLSCRPARLSESAGPQTPVHLSDWSRLTQRCSV